MRKTFSSNDVVKLSTSSTTVHLHVINDLTLMSLWLTDPPPLLFANGDESFISDEWVSLCIGDAMRQGADASPCNSIKRDRPQNLRNQFFKSAGF